MSRFGGLLLIVGLLGRVPLGAQESSEISLSGEWFFAVDPLRVGVERGWNMPDASEVGRGWDAVIVPHAWPTDPRFHYVGTAWYQRAFSVPADWQGQNIRLAFGAVFQLAHVWVNGEYVGEHEGGYTPFAFDVTRFVRPGEENVIAVSVDNSWDLTTVPGARPGNAPRHQVYPWWDYGGIVRDVSLLANPPLYVLNQKVSADPDLEQGTAELDATVWVVNASDRPRSASVGLEVRRDGETAILQGWRNQRALRSIVTVPAGDTVAVRLRTLLPRAQVGLWGVDRPNLYEARALVWDGRSPVAGSSHAHRATFGIRKLEIREAQLLLNGEPIRMGGGNRHSDHPQYGLIEPDVVIHPQMRQMKEAGMDLSRILHYAAPKNMLEWADRNGKLIIAEAGNWQLSPEQMDDPMIRRKFQQQMREMVERDWNHPSIIGWSMGNEYQADVPAGVRWTREMGDVVRGLDDTRFITFVEGGNLIRPTEVPREERSAHYSDLIMVTLYWPPEELGEGLRRVHATWPDKPILIAEFGMRSDQATEEERAAYLRDFMQVVRDHPFIVNASIWTFNDYRSRFPATNPDGTRPWGVIDWEGNPRPLYDVIREEFSPVMVDGEVTGGGSQVVSGRIRLTGRDDFPRYILRDYTVRYQLLDAAGRMLHEEVRPLAELRPGQTVELTFSTPAGSTAGVDRVRAEVVRPTGFSTMSREFQLGGSGR